MIPKIYNDMSLQGVSEDRLNLKSYQTIMNRLKMEEACVQSGLASGAGGSSGGLAAASPAAAGTSQTNNNTQDPANTSSIGSIFSTSMLSSFTNYSSSASSASSNNLNNSTNATGQQANAAPNINSPLAGSHSSNLGSSSIRAQQHQQTQSFGPGANLQRKPVDLQLIGQQQNQSQQDSQEQQENIADRALQSATRMFKGLWSWK